MRLSCAIDGICVNTEKRKKLLGSPVLYLMVNIVAPMYSLYIYARRQQPCNSQDEKWPRFSQFQQWIKREKEETTCLGLSK